MKTYTNADTAFLDTAYLIHQLGQISKPRGQEIKEFINYGITIANPFDTFITTKPRKLKPVYLVAELLWYYLGDNLSTEIGNFAKIWNGISDQRNIINSNYGAHIYKDMSLDTFKAFPHNPKYKHISDNSQFMWVVNELQNDPDSRRAVFNINSIHHKIVGTADVPCTINMQFFIRDNKLHTIINMRSCDLVYGFCNDVFQFSMIATELFIALKTLHPEQFEELGMGNLSMNFGSLHVYERHYSMLEEIKEDYTNLINISNARAHKQNVMKTFANSSHINIAEISLSPEVMKNLWDNMTPYAQVNATEKSRHMNDDTIIHLCNVNNYNATETMIAIMAGCSNFEELEERVMKIKQGVINARLCK